MKTGAKLKYNLRVLAAFLLLSFGMAGELAATHIMGGSLTYKYIGNNRYEVDLSFYRDCSDPKNAKYPDSLTLHIKGVYSQAHSTKVMHMVTEPVNLETPVSACTFSETCAEVTYYRDTVEVWNDEGGFHLWISTKARNTVILNYAEGEIIWYAFIPPFKTINASPNIVKHAVPFLCAGQDFKFNAGFYDPDGDSLYFSFSQAYNNGLPPDFNLLQLNASYTVERPFGFSSGPVKIDPASGLISGRADNSGNYVLVVEIDEYRTNRFTGQVIHIGTVRVDLQMVVLACATNLPPKWDTDPAGLTRSVNFGDTVGINVSGADADDELLTVSAYGSMLGGIAGFPKPWASFEKKPDIKKASGTFTWVPGCEHITTNGPHIVTFILTDKSCNTVEQSYQVFVNYDFPDGLKLELGNDTALCEGDTLLLDAGTLNAVWDDGSRGRYRKVFSAGEYQVTYSPYEGCKISQVSDHISVGVNELPPPLKHRSFTICPGDTVLDPGGSPELVYHWSNGTESDLLHVNAAGTYYVEISNQYCSLTDSVVVKEFSPEIIALGNDTFLCLGDTLLLDAGFDEVKWEDGSTGRLHKVFKEGTYTASYKPFPKCEVSNSIFVAGFKKPSPLPVKHFSICAGDTMLNTGGDPALSYAWSTGDSTPYFHVSKAGLYYVQISNGNCQIKDWAVVTEFDAIPMDLGPDILTCTLPVQLDAEYEGAVWQDGSNGRYLNATSPGKYSATYISPKGCMATDSIYVSLAGIPDVNLGNNKLACTGEEVVLDAGAEARLYIWNTGETTRQIKVTAPGLYWLKAYSEHCMAYDSVKVNYKAVPQAHLPQKISLCPMEGESLTLDGGGDAFAYLWEPGGEMDKIIILSDTGTYTLKAFNELGCYTTASIEVADGCNGTLYIPNVFTPNDDGINQLFTAYGTYISKFSMKIYNRWGECLFESNDINQGWDGAWKDKPVPGGVYLYSVSAEAKGGSIYKSGVVNLIR